MSPLSAEQHRETHEEINNCIFSTRVKMCRTQGLELQSSEDSLAEDTEGGLCVCTKWYLILSNDNANVKPGQANTVHEILMILLPHLFSS